MILDMKRNKIIDLPGLDNRLAEHKQCIAFHEAGHATAIYLNNRAQNLPPVFFQILFNDVNEPLGACDNYIARVDGGRLIQSLPHSMDAFLYKLTVRDEPTVQSVVEDYVVAFEADVVNLLVGPLAEAKHVADTDNEPFNFRLINVEALKNYGGNSDLESVYEYLQSYSSNKQQQDAKLDELFTVAFNFVNDYKNWRAISKLAHYFIGSDKNMFGCEEVIAVLESADRDDFSDKRALLDRYVAQA